MMKFSAGLVFAGALLGLAGNANAQTPPEIQKDQKVVASTTPAPMIAPLGVGTAFNASLEEALDTRHAKAGDAVNAEAAEDVYYQRSVIFPKGTKIVGHLVKVTTAGKGHTGSAIFVQFDKAVMKDGQEITLHAGIQALAVTDSIPPESLKSSADAQAGAVENDSDANSDTTVVSTNYQDARAPLVPAPVAGKFSSDGLFSSDSRGAFGRPDLKMYTPTSGGSHGTVITSSKKSLHLDPGTHLLLVVQPPPTESTDGAAPSAGETEPPQR
jgi:hypothetical protein